MEHSPVDRSPRRRGFQWLLAEESKNAIAIAGTYFVVAILWILTSDALLAHLTSSVDLLIWLGQVKGSLFVGLTAVLLFLATRRSVASLVKTRNESVLAYQAREASEARFRGIYEHAPAAILIADWEGRLEACNAAACKLLGYREDELSGVFFEDIIHPDDRPREKAQAELLRSGTENWVEIESRYVRKSGANVCVRKVIAALPNPGGRPKFVVVAVDLTDLKRAHEALRKFSRVIEQAACAVVITDADGIIEYVNPAFSKITGFSEQEVIGESPSQMASKNNLDIDAAIWRVVRGGDVWQGEVLRRRKNGSDYWESVVVTPIRDQLGVITHYAGIADDITERKRNAEDLAEARRLETVGQLAGGVAHDFNNLMTIIAGNLEIARDSMSPGDARFRVCRALEATELGAGLTRRLLTMSRKQPHDPKLTTLNSRAEEAMGLLRALLSEEINVEMRLAAEPWFTLADPGEIDSAIFNLASNSRDAMPHGGSVCIETANVSLSSQDMADLRSSAAPGDYVRMSFIDEGVGMTKEVFERAVEPFFTTKEPGKGTGLGLSTVAAFAKQCNGFIHIRSVPGDGCTVAVYLPRALAPASSDHPPENPQEPQKRKLVLVVEDDDLVREVTLARVEGLGYLSASARNGKDAIEILKGDSSIDIVLSDVVMGGGVSGFELAQWISTNKPHLGVILSSGFNNARHSAPSDELSGVAYLDKPYTRGQLADALGDARLRTPA